MTFDDSGVHYFCPPPLNTSVSPPLANLQAFGPILTKMGSQLRVLFFWFHLNRGCEGVGRVYLFSLLYSSDSCTCSLSHLMLACQGWLACALVHIGKSSSLGARNQNSELTTLVTCTGWAARNTCCCAALNGQFSSRYGCLVQHFSFRTELCIYLRLTEGLCI